MAMSINSHTSSWTVEGQDFYKRSLKNEQHGRNSSEQRWNQLKQERTSQGPSYLSPEPVSALRRPHSALPWSAGHPVLAIVSPELGTTRRGEHCAETNSAQMERRCKPMRRIQARHDHSAGTTISSLCINSLFWSGSWSPASNIRPPHPRGHCSAMQTPRELLRSGGGTPPPRLASAHRNRCCVPPFKELRSDVAVVRTPGHSRNLSLAESQAGRQLI